MFGGETVQVLHAGTSTDPYSLQTVLDWSTGVTEMPVPGVLCEPRPSTEPTQEARNAVTDGWTLYMPAGTAVTAADRVRVRGVVYDVAGDGADWRLGGWRPGLVVQATRTEG